MSTLQISWFVLIGALLAGYMILDGYDLGVGFWHLLARSSNARRSLRSAITPYWDANEVWLITAGGALFAAFPMVYATVFSGFYPALMLLIFALVFRGVSIEYVAHASDKAKGLWEVAFGAGSTLAALLFGIAAGNLMRGLPLDAQGNFTGSFVDLFGWFPLLTGVAGLALFAMHGGLFLLMNQDETVAAMARKWALLGWAAYLILLIGCYFAAGIAATDLMAKIRATPGLWPFYPLLMLCVAGIGVLIGLNRARQAFLCSCISIIVLLASIGAAIYPNMVPSRGAGRSLSIVDSSSSELTLGIMFLVAVIGMAAMLAYTYWVRKVFKGGSVEY